MSMIAKLKAANEAYQQGRQGQTPPPDGDLLLQLVKVEIGESATTGSLFIRREHLICEGELEGTTFSDFLSITKAQGEPSSSAWRIDRWIEEMGYEAMDDIGEDLEPILQDLNERQPYYYASIRTTFSNGRAFTNVENCQLYVQEPEKPNSASQEAGEEAEQTVDETEDDGGYARLFGVAVANGLGAEQGIVDGVDFDTLLQVCQSVEWPVENFDSEEEIEFMKAMGMDIAYPKVTSKVAPKTAPKASTMSAPKTSTRAVTAPKTTPKATSKVAPKAAPKAVTRLSAPKSVATPVRRK